METNQSKGEHWSAALLSLSPRPQTALFLIVRVKESEVALSGAGATYRAPIICLDKVLGGTKAAWSGGGKGGTSLHSIGGWLTGKHAELAEELAG